ncbi:MAG: hypothetical protein HYX73_02145 [Acidobacteria bacterium]|nr:hypothetical protein [Acidobacteriota bacterium]
MKIGTRSFPYGRQYHSPAPKRGRRIAVIVALPVFVFQFSLSLLLHPVNQILCLEELNPSPTAASHDHHHDHADPLLDSHTAPPAGNTMQHCKDTLFGISVTPLQPFSLPFAPTSQELAISWASPTYEFEALCERSPAPPYQPPRA